MDSATYLKERVEDQIEWMNGKSKWNQTRYKTIKVMEIVAAALVPLLSGYQTTQAYLGFIVGILGVAIVILTSLRQLNKYQENWLTYRTTLESMKREKFLFEACAPPYDDESAYQKFVMNIESLLAKENESWKAVWSKKEDEIKTPPAAPPDPEIEDNGEAAKDNTVVEPAAADNTDATAGKPADTIDTTVTDTTVADAADGTGATDTTDTTEATDETDTSAEKDK